MSRNFNENTRVQVPATLHLCKLGYTYLDKIDFYDHSTNILTGIFLSQLAKLNPLLSEQDCKNYLTKLIGCLNNEDLGKEFYSYFSTKSGIRLIDFDNLENNTWHVTTEFTCENEDVQILMNMNKALRTTEVLGQIIKNTQGEIEKPDIEYAYFELEKVYMRICNMFLTEFQKQEPEFLKFISQRIQETSTKVIDRKELSMITYKTMGSFYFMSIYASIKRTANCLGSAELTKIAKKVAYDNACPFSLCSYYQTVLWYEKRVPLDDMKKEFQNFSPVMQQLCRVLLVEYADFHSIDGKHKQQIAQAFCIPIKKLYLDGTK